MFRDHHHDAFFHLQLQCADVELNLLCNMQLCFLVLRFKLPLIHWQVCMASSSLSARFSIDFVCSGSAFEILKLIDFDFFSIAWIIIYLWVVSFLVCILAVGFSTAFENSKLT